jgi:hypothetical protein
MSSNAQRSPFDPANTADAVRTVAADDTHPSGDIEFKATTDGKIGVGVEIETEHVSVEGSIGVDVKHGNAVEGKVSGKISWGK